MTSVKFVPSPITAGKDMLGFEAAALVRQEVWSSLPRKLTRVVVCERGALRTVRKQLLGPEQNNRNIINSSVNTLLGEVLMKVSQWIVCSYMFMIFHLPTLSKM